MKQFICFLLCAILIGSFLSLSTGCSRHPFYKKKQIFLIDLKKKIGIAEFDNRLKKISDTNIETFYQRIVSDMKRSDSSLIFSMSDGKPEILSKSSRLLSTDHIDRQALIKSGREKGYQAIIWGDIYDIQIISKKTGIIGFRKEKKHVRFRGEFSLFDCGTQAKLWYAPIEEIFLFESLFDPMENKIAIIDDLTIERVLSRLSKIITEQMSFHLKKEPWKGFIIDNNNDEYLISSGHKSGLLNHMIFDVIGSMGTLAGIYGQKYDIPGNTIGRIQLIEVNDHNSKAIALYGNKLENSIAIQELTDK
ncbi:conserved hypothetical protein, secreted [Candidatus Magnetomorum sp. HK-1]|nr:conserved hypothetical protein, secreted [Candidatus Magnetomorum sp. HK-1]